MSYRRKRQAVPNHIIQDDLEDQVMRLKPKMDALEKIEKIQSETGDKTLLAQIKQARKEINDSVNVLAQKFGVSYIDVYSKVQAEKDKNKVLEGRVKAQQRQKQGQEEDVIDLLDESGLVLGTVKKESDIPQHFRPYISRWEQYQKGFDPEEIQIGEQDLANLKAHLNLHDEYNPGFIIPHKTKSSAKGFVADMNRRKFIQEQTEHGVKQQDLRARLMDNIRTMMRGGERKAEEKKRALDESAKEAEELQERNREQHEDREQYLNDVERDRKERFVQAFEKMASKARASQALKRAIREARRVAQENQYLLDAQEFADILLDEPQLSKEEKQELRQAFDQYKKQTINVKKKEQAIQKLSKFEGILAGQKQKKKDLLKTGEFAKEELEEGKVEQQPIEGQVQQLIQGKEEKDEKDFTDNEANSYINIFQKPEDKRTAQDYKTIQRLLDPNGAELKQLENYKSNEQNTKSLQQLILQINQQQKNVRGWKPIIFNPDDYENMSQQISINNWTSIPWDQMKSYLEQISTLKQGKSKDKLADTIAYKMYQAYRLQYLLQNQELIPEAYKDRQPIERPQPGTVRSVKLWSKSRPKALEKMGGIYSRIEAQKKQKIAPKSPPRKQ